MDRVINTCLNLRNEISKCQLFLHCSAWLTQIFDDKILQKVNRNHKLACAMSPLAFFSWKKQPFYYYDSNHEIEVKDRLSTFEKYIQVENSTLRNETEQVEIDLFMLPVGCNTNQLKGSLDSTFHLANRFPVLLDEFESYQTSLSEILKEFDMKFLTSPLQLWQKLKTRYPSLYQVAMFAFSFQATCNLH